MNLNAYTRFFMAILAITLWGGFCHAQNTGPNNPDYCRIKQKSDNVDLFTGDVHYTLPLFRVPGPDGGFSFDLTYLSGITADQEASWVGLGWSLFPGAITRNVNGFPDDWSGAKVQCDLDNSLSEFTVISNPAHNSYVTPGFRRIMGHSKSLLGFRKRTFTDDDDEDEKTVYGTLYMDAARSSTNSTTLRKQSGASLMDVYSINPYEYNWESSEVSMASSTSIEKGNSMLMPNYDTYHVRTRAYTGTMSPKIFECVNLTGETRDSDDLNYYYCPGNDGLSISKPYFYMDNSLSSYYRVDSEGFSNTNTEPQDFHLDVNYIKTLPEQTRGYYNDSVFYNESSKRIGAAYHIVYFTNNKIRDSIATAKANGFIEARCLGSRPSSSFPSSGIGAYTIVYPNGVKYHFSLPVYQLGDETYHSENTSNTNDWFKYERKEIYAYAWLLTAITGPDYVDNGVSGFDESDHGYWVEFNYVQATNVEWESYHRTSDGVSGGTTYKHPDQGNTNHYDSYWEGTKQVYYLASARTRSHIAKFFFQPNNKDGGGQYLVNKIVVLKDRNPSIPTSILTDASTDEPKAIRVVDLDYIEYSGNDNNFLSKIKIKGHKNNDIVPSYKFEYNQDQQTATATEQWGYWKNDPAGFSLSAVELPLGGKTEFEYESDVYRRWESNDTQWEYPEGSGGGLRIKKIRSRESSSTFHETLFSYDYPENEDGEKLTSGMVYYEPMYNIYSLTITKIGLPRYYTELPCPEVMYNQVSVFHNWSSDNNDHNYSHVKRYNFFTGVDHESLEQKGVVTIEKQLSKAQKITDGDTYEGDTIKTFNNVLHDNTSRIGALESLQEMNRDSHLVNQSIYTYFRKRESQIYWEEIDGEMVAILDVLQEEPVAGTREESFLTRKLVTVDGERSWILAANSRVWHPTIIKRMLNVKEGLVSQMTNKKIDFYSGKVLGIGSGKSGNSVVPAFHIDRYSGMGPKTINPDNSHQLTAIAETMRFDSDSNYLANNITIWEKNYTYREFAKVGTVDCFKDAPGLTGDFYRAKDSWKWQGPLLSDGTFKAFSPVGPIDQTDNDKRFDWDNGQTNKNKQNGWKRVNSVKRFSPYSSILETRNQAGIYFATKYDAVNEKMITGSSNATYLQFCYTGFENEKATTISGVTHFGSEVIGYDLNCTTKISAGIPPSERTYNGITYAVVPGVVAHTGSFYLETSNHTSPMYRMIYDGDRGVRQGRYWASVWVHNNSDDDTELKLEFFNDDPRSLNSVTMKKSESNLVVDNWVQLNVYIDVPACATYDKLMLYVTTPLGTSAYIDDLRLQPVDAKVSANVFHQETGLKVAELGETNFAVKLEYDAKGEVTAVYKETLKYGFKKVSESDYNYARGVND